MKSADVFVLMAAGLLTWVVGTIYFANQGRVIFETHECAILDSPHAYSDCLSSILCCHPSLAADCPCPSDDRDAPSGDSRNAW
jgi:hypothetical protein